MIPADKILESDPIITFFDPVVLLYPAFLPIAILSDPVELYNALLPTATLLEELELYNERLPIEIFSDPVVLVNNELLPILKLSFPFVLLNNDFQPIDVIPSEVELYAD